MKNGNYTLGHHLVAFLDVLGQRDKFRGLKKPTNAQEEEEVKEVLEANGWFRRRTAHRFSEAIRGIRSRDAKYAAAHKRAIASEFHRLLRFIRYISSPARRGSMSWCPCKCVFSPVSGLCRHANRTCQQTSFAGRN